MSGTAFFVLAKIVGAGIRVETWLVLLALAGFGAQILGRRRAATWLIGGLLALLAMLTFVPVGPWAIRPLEAQFPAAPPLAAQPDGILVLGGAVQVGLWRRTGQVHTNEAGERLTEAALLARRFPDVPVILTGGSGALSSLGGIPVSEAQAMAALLTGLGVDPERLVLEGASRNTAANAEYTRDIVRPQPGQSFVLVTSASHMPRAVESFRRAGWPELVPWPVDYTPGSGDAGLIWNMALNLDTLNRAIKEYVGRIAYAGAARL